MNIKVSSVTFGAKFNLQKLSACNGMQLAWRVRPDVFPLHSFLDADCVMFFVCALLGWLLCLLLLCSDDLFNLFPRIVQVGGRRQQHYQVGATTSCAGPTRAVGAICQRDQKDLVMIL